MKLILLVLTLVSFNLRAEVIAGSEDSGEYTNVQPYAPARQGEAVNSSLPQIEMKDSVDRASKINKAAICNFSRKYQFLKSSVYHLGLQMQDSRSASDWDFEIYRWEIPLKKGWSRTDTYGRKYSYDGSALRLDAGDGDGYEVKIDPALKSAEQIHFRSSHIENGTRIIDISITCVPGLS